jgi:DNA-binding CsgD family transcriptional regulator
MHRIFQDFVDCLAESADASSLREAMASASAALDLSCFAYLTVPRRQHDETQLVSTYPSAWTSYYLQSRYERLDPVVIRARGELEPFEWGAELGTRALSTRQRQLFDEAGQFGIRCGFTIPIHDRRGQVAAVTFAADLRHPPFIRAIEAHGRILQLMAMYFHAHARRKLIPQRMIDGVALSPREFECLAWAARGKSAWDIGCILGISRRTAAFHLENAKAKLGVKSTCQAVARMAASNLIIP